jgi:hypothetical protein
MAALTWSSVTALQMHANTVLAGFPFAPLTLDYS